ncbi:MAG: DUF1501 domain-containing protein [Myxococcota bacterium]
MKRSLPEIQGVRSRSTGQWSRREAFAALSFGGGLAAFGGLGPLLRLANAAGPETAASDRYFLFCYFNGGWDVLLGLDPRDPDVFTADVRADTRIEPGYDTLQDVGKVPLTLSSGVTVGPYFGRLADYADQVAIVRGMSMETLTHEAGRRRFITGKPPSGLLARGSSIASYLAANLGSDHPIPNIAMNHEAYNPDLPAFATALQVASTDDLVRALSPGEYDLDPALRARTEELLEQIRTCDANQTSLARSDALDFRLSARELVEQGLDALFDFGSSSPEMVALRARYGISTSNLKSNAAASAMAVTALTAGISRCASITVASGLDTHYSDWQRNQGPNQQAGFDLVAAIADDLASRDYNGTGTSWLDHTVIVGFSEFSRTSLLNDAGGRDHALTNACFLLGGGIRGGRVLGASSDVGLEPQAIDLATGALDPAGEIPKPEHVLRALMTEVGIDTDDADLRVDPLAALFG